MAKGIPMAIEIDGVLYPSQRAAAQALGVSQSWVSLCLRRGRKPKPRRPPTPVIIQNRKYDSVPEAARALGYSAVHIYAARKAGKLDRLGDSPSSYRDGPPVTIRGVRYPSRAVAAETLGIKRSTLAKRISDGKLSSVGLGRNGTRGTTLCVNGVEYHSIRAAAKALGCRRSLEAVMRRATECP